MKICTSCKKELPDEALFCANCGAKVESEKNNTEQKDAEILFCPACGNKLDSGYEFCPACGNRIAQQMGLEKENEKKSLADGRTKKKGVYILLVLAVVLIAGVGALCIVWKTGKKNTSRLFYVKDDRLYMKDGKEDVNMLSGKILEKTENKDEYEYDEAMVATEEYDEDEYYEDEDEDEYYEDEYYEDEYYEDQEAEPDKIEDYVTVYEDEERIVYPEDMLRSYDEEEDDHDIQYSLYYRSLKDPDTEPVKIDSKIEGYYEVTENGSRIFYIKNGDLYAYNFETKEKIGRNVEQFKVNSDGSRIVYCGGSGLYCKENGIEKMLSDTEHNWFAVSDDFSKICYVNEVQELYLADFDGNSKKLAENIDESALTGTSDLNTYVLKVYNTGEVYYTVNEKKQLNAADYIINDVASGEVVEEPEYPELPEYPERSDYDDEKAYEKACKKYNKAYEKWEEAYAEYFAAYEAYETAASWNELNAEIEQATFSVTDTVYYYYNGTESKEIGRITGQGKCYDYAEQKAAGIFACNDDTAVQSVKLSECMGEDGTVEDITVEGLVIRLQNLFPKDSSNSKAVLALGGVACELPDRTLQGAYDICLHEDAGCITFLQDGDLVKIKITEGELQKEEIYDTDVLGYTYLDSAKDDIIYVKDYDSDNMAAGLYRNKKRIDNVAVMTPVGPFQFIKIDGNTVYYLKEWDADGAAYCDGGEGTLMMYNNDEVERIASGVYSMFAEDIDGKSCLFYTTDFEKEEDELETYSVYCLKNGKQVKLADDVNDYMVLEDGSFYYLTDYNMKKGNGDLYIYNKKQNELVDTNVQALADIDVVEE